MAILIFVADPLWERAGFGPISTETNFQFFVRALFVYWFCWSIANFLFPLDIARQGAAEKVTRWLFRERTI